jgi:hypothetical protein
VLSFCSWLEINSDKVDRLVSLTQNLPLGLSASMGVTTVRWMVSVSLGEFGTVW